MSVKSVLICCLCFNGSKIWVYEISKSLNSAFYLNLTQHANVFKTGVIISLFSCFPIYPIGFFLPLTPSCHLLIQFLLFTARLYYLLFQLFILFPYCVLKVIVTLFCFLWLGFLPVPLVLTPFSFLLEKVFCFCILCFSCFRVDWAWPDCLI